MEYAAQFNGDTFATTRQIKTIIGYFAAAGAAGDVVEIDTAVDPPGGGVNAGVNAWKTMTSQKGAGVLVRAVAAGGYGEIQVLGVCDTVKADAFGGGAVQIAIGDFVSPALTDGRVGLASATANPQTSVPVLGRALSALASGTGTISAELFNPHGY